MVVVEHDPENNRQRVVVRPNCSLSWPATKRVIAGFAMLLSVVGAAFAWLGFWLVLPFAGLELLALAAGLYLVARHNQQCQIIDLERDSIRIRSGRYRKERHWVLPRIWARVVLERCPKRWYPSRLLICSHSQSVEIGRFLNEEERQRLASELSRSL